MKRTFLSRYAQQWLRQGQVGQSVVILAFGFIVLLAFVGIVTDVSLLFVRYSTLRRSVDAAAVAAAGQIRRTVPTAEEETRAQTNCGSNWQRCADGYAIARSVANYNLSARQFIEFYGLSPSNVRVDSCDTLPTTRPTDAIEAARWDALECGATSQPRKLVQVTAQVESPTIFLRLIGWGTITLEASAISESAVLDVVLIFDGSESMANQTSYADWEAINMGMRYLPPRLNSGPNIWGNEARFVQWTPAYDWINMWLALLNMTQNQVNADPRFPVTPFFWNGTRWVRWNGTSTPPTGYGQPRPDCRVRMFPAADAAFDRIPDGGASGSGEYVASDDVWQEYTSFLRSEGILSSSQNYPTRYDGFVPAYNYFGCCNDPNGDGRFNDLICRPFRQMRDSAEQFLDRIDFARGDRVAFVTFDRSAYLVDPDGTVGTQDDAGNPVIDPATGSRLQQLPMITNREQAITALRRIVGVRAEPNFYADMNNDGLWDAYVVGGAPYDPTSARSGRVFSYDYQQEYNPATNSWVSGGFNNTRLGLLNDYPVQNNCYFLNATRVWPYSLFSSPANATIAASWGSTYVPSRFPTPYAAFTASPTYAMANPALMLPNLNDTSWDTQMRGTFPNSTTQIPNGGTTAVPNLSRQVQKALYSYDFRAGCGGSNVGAALRQGNNALLDVRTIRSANSGAVWIMVLLGDGAAASSDPVRRNNQTLQPGDPYGSATSAPPRASSYGAYGLCPYGTPTSRKELVDEQGAWETAQPRCMDESYTSRHFCTGAAGIDPNNAAFDIGVAGSCEMEYDVDDYARDWADYIGLVRIPATSPFSRFPEASEERSNFTLPTIFTIGFGLDFQRDTNGDGQYNCADSANLNDCLGEELLRYIADVGDNNRLDTDYQQDVVADGRLDGNLGPGEVYGDRGPCEAPLPGYQNADQAKASGAFSSSYAALLNNPLQSKRDCGNYFNAPDAAKLDRVFDEIASRMFTRLTR
jgi:hypothetical protein